MAPVVLALGSNLGDSLRYLREALRELCSVTTELHCSSVYRSDPMYLVDQPAYLNAVVVAQTTLAPRALLTELKAIETRLGREATVRNGPRVIDVDLIAYGSLRLTSYADDRSTLEIPHPRLAERRFVLEPLFEIAPEIRIPGLPVVDDMLRVPQLQRQGLERIVDAPIPL